MADEKLDEILSVVKTLNIKLYGEGSFEGDIPEIKAGLKNHNRRIRRLELIVAGLVVTGGGIAGLVKWLGG